MSIHSNQVKDNCFISVGDLIKITLKDNCKCKKNYIGIIECIDIRIQNNTKHDGFHTVIDIKEDNSSSLLSSTASIWLENIKELEVIRFSNEN